MKSLVYVGKNKRLKGKSALIQDIGNGKIKVQFNDIGLCVGGRRFHPQYSYGFRWVEFDKQDFMEIK